MSGYTRAVVVGLVAGSLLSGVLWLTTGYDGIVHPPLWAAVPVGLALGVAAGVVDRRRSQ